VAAVIGLDARAETDVKRRLRAFAIETPSWGYGNSGTRFKTFAWPGAARSIWERIADAGHVHALTGAAPSVACHIPWDRVDDWGELVAYAHERGVRLGAINPNLFQDDRYKLGSLCHPDAAVREMALEHMAECCAIMQATGSTVLSIWLADGTNYAGQDDLAARKERLEEGLRRTYALLPPGSRMLIEYKFFEPAFYHTDLPDWGTAYAMSLKCGPQAQVLVDTGHHAQGTNVPQIVSFLLSEGRLGGFHLNARRYADDDLMVGSDNPFELFVIFATIIQAGAAAADLAFMLDQVHAIEAKVEATIQSVVNCQTAWAKALLVDRSALAAAQAAGDVLAAHRVLTDAFQHDVRGLLRELREEQGLPPDPIAAHRASGYAERIAAERGFASIAGGFPAGD
jgi:L-rhamnose isomerase / sugar isomerase